MKLTLKYKAGVESYNESPVLFDYAFEKAISKLKDKNSTIHQWVDQELEELELISSKVKLVLDSDNQQVLSQIVYILDRKPTQEELDIIIQETTIQLTDGYGETPWIAKTSNGKAEITLIDLYDESYPIDVKLSKAKSPIKDQNKCTKKLEKAAEKGKIEQVKAFVENGGNPNCQHTLLMIAILNEQEEIALYLINHGVDINKADDDDNNTALFNTCFDGQTSIAKVLIDKGAIVDQICRLGMTSLMMAANRNHLDLVKLLVAKGAQINLQCDNGYTALTYTSSPEIVQFLLRQGGDITIKNFLGNAFEKFTDSLETAKTYDNEESINKYQKILEILQKHS